MVSSPGRLPNDWTVSSLKRKHRSSAISSANGTITDVITAPLTVASIAAVSPDPRNSVVSTIDVTFSTPINTSSLTAGALTLTDNNGPNLITSAVTLSLASGSTYQIDGLSTLTGTSGNYTVTLNAAGIQDTNGNPGSGSLSASWLMDSVPPTSHVSALPKTEAGLTFAVSANQIAVHHFDRLLGDVAGDGIVDQNDLAEIAADIGATSQMGWTPLSADVTGSGAVTTIDLTIATRSKNRKLGAGLSLG